MSWSVSATGKPAEVKAELEHQFSYPLADAPAGLSDEGEKETVRRTADMVGQCLSTFDPEKPVRVTASGHMGFNNWDTKEGAYQSVNVSISPTA